MVLQSGEFLVFNTSVNPPPTVEGWNKTIGTVNKTIDCICFDEELVNATLPDKCIALYNEALQVKTMYYVIIALLLFSSIMFPVMTFYFYKYVRTFQKKMRENNGK